VVAIRGILIFKPGLIVLDVEGVGLDLIPFASSFNSTLWFGYSLGWSYVVDIVGGL